MSGDIICIAEHRQGGLRDITFELLTLAYGIAREKGLHTTCLLLEDPEQSLEEGLKGWCHKVLVVKGEGLSVFSQEIYESVTLSVISDLKPSLVLIPHTPWGMDLAPSLAVKSGNPVITDCTSLQMEDGRPKATRQIYGGKIFSQVSCRPSQTYLISLRPGSVNAQESPSLDTLIEQAKGISIPKQTKKSFKEFLDTSAGEIDITQAPFLISIGRGIGEQENIEQARELAEKMGAVLSCSRPIVDKNWLPKYHQVGTSGKTVKPKVYLALGISGAFQHVAGIKAGTIIAVNKDKKAPIFRVAQYGVVEDLFKVIAALKEKIGG